jgi:hypothetical protein
VGFSYGTAITTHTGGATERIGLAISLDQFIGGNGIVLSLSIDDDFEASLLSMKNAPYHRLQFSGNISREPNQAERVATDDESDIFLDK